MYKLLITWKKKENPEVVGKFRTYDKAYRHLHELCETLGYNPDYPYNAEIKKVKLSAKLSYKGEME